MTLGGALMSTPPTTGRGYVDDALLSDIGVSGYGSLVDAVLEHVPDLVWPRSIATFARMRHDPQLAAILKVYFLAIQRARWAVDPAGCRDEVAAQVADDVGLPILGVDDEPAGARRRAFVFPEHLRLSLLDLVYGHMFFEQTYAEANGKWRLATVQERMPQTVEEVKLNRDGTIRYIEQAAFIGSQQPTRITTADHRLVYYVNEREGSNYFGRSLIRPAFGMWLVKDQVLRVHATSIRRFGMGVYEVNAPEGATPQQIAEAQRLAGNYKASEHAGVGLPHGFSGSLRGLQGNVPDAVAFLEYVDRQMTRATLTSLLDMATASRGSRSLGETVMDVMVYAQQAVADSHGETATSQIVVPLVDANWGEDEAAPRIVCSDVGADLELTPEDVYQLMTAGALIGDPELWSWIRERYRIPDIDPAFLPDPNADTTPDPAATAQMRAVARAVAEEMRAGGPQRRPDEA